MNSGSLPEFSCNNKFYPRMERGKYLALRAEAIHSTIQRKQQVSKKQGTGGGFQVEKELLVLVLVAEHNVQSRSVKSTFCFSRYAQLHLPRSLLLQDSKDYGLAVVGEEQ